MRTVLESVATGELDATGMPEWFNLPAVDRSQRESLRRAARRLAERGEVEIGHRRGPSGRREFVVRRRLTDDEARIEMGRLEEYFKHLAASVPPEMYPGVVALQIDEFMRYSSYKDRLSVEETEGQHLGDGG
jgi:hypothetical protein